MPRRLLLIVEDDRALRDLYRLALSLSNFAVHACEDGLEALRYLEQEQPDVIVLDLNLPRVSGRIVYEELHAHAETVTVPVIVVTGVYSVPDLLGATILRKPVSAEELIRVVNRVLTQRRQDWLFGAGPRSVRIVRTEEREQVRLVVYGPGSATDVCVDGDVQTALRRQKMIERRLAREGYRLVSSDRRAGRERRATPRGEPDRRRQHDALL